MSYETRAAEFVVRYHKHETIDVCRRDYFVDISHLHFLSEKIGYSK